MPRPSSSFAAFPCLLASAPITLLTGCAGGSSQLQGSGSAIVDSTHVTVDIPASDLAAAGTATLTAVNPGASAFSGLSITIQ